MGFVEEVMGAGADRLAPCEYRLTVLGRRCVYVEGIRCVKSFSEEEILLGLKGCCLRITGRGMYIEKFCGGDVEIKGSVTGIERLSV